MSNPTKRKYDIRQDPFTGVVSPLDIWNEECTIPGASPFYIYLEEVPQNNAISTTFVHLTDTINEEFSASDTVLTVAHGSYWNVNDIILIQNEILKITAVSGNDLTVQRAYGDQSGPAVAHPNGTRFRNIGAEELVNSNPVEHGINKFVERTSIPQTSGEFQVHYGTEIAPYKRGIVRFHESDANKIVWVSYKGLGHYNWAEHINELQFFRVGNFLEAFSDSEVKITEDNWTLKKSIMIAKAGALRISFQFKNSGYRGYARIARNGVFVGTEHYYEHKTNGWITLVEDIDGWNVRDSVELHLKIALGPAFARNFRIYVHYPTTSFVLL